jgi:hypothetical protein
MINPSETKEKMTDYNQPAADLAGGVFIIMA